MKLPSGVAAANSGARRAACAAEHPDDREEGGVGRAPVLLEVVVHVDGQALGERDPGQAVEGALAGAGDRAAPEDEAEAGVEPDVDPAQDRLRPHGQEVVQGDVDAVARRPIDDPGGASEAGVDPRGMHGPVPGLGRAGPALLDLRGHDKGLVPRGEERADQLVEEDGPDPVVVRYQQPHPARTGRPPRGRPRPASGPPSPSSRPCATGGPFRSARRCRRT